MVSRRGRALRALPLLLLTLALVVGVTGTSGAAPPPLRPKLCNALGFLKITGAPGAWNWDLLTGSGNCFGDGGGPYILTGSGSGTSTSLGLCDGLLVQNLSLDINLTLFSLKDATTQTRHENWIAAITTFPLVTPFLIRDPVSGNLQGGGAILTRFGLKCPPGGAPQSVILTLRLV